MRPHMKETAMLPNRPSIGERAGRLTLPRHVRLAVLVTVGLGSLLGAGLALAAEVVTGPVPIKHVPVAQVFTFLFLMLGPFKIIGPFAKMTKDADAAATRQTALWGTLFASLALAVAAFLGNSILDNYGIPLPVLALSAGIILFLVALLGILQQFMPLTTHTEGNAAAAPIEPLKTALTQLAFPTIVTPYGIATLVVFLALSQSPEARLTIGAVVLAIMLLNLAVMLAARRIMPVLGILLPILGAVLGVVQVALGLQIIHNSLKAMGLI